GAYAASIWLWSSASLAVWAEAGAAKNASAMTTPTKLRIGKIFILGASIRLRRLADHDKRRPVFRVGPVRMQRIVDHGEHGLSQGLGVRQFWIACSSSKSAGHQRDRAVALDYPVRHQQRAPAGIEEGARQARQRFRAGLVAGGRVAGRQHHPFGIELQPCDLARGQKAVVERA